MYRTTLWLPSAGSTPPARTSCAVQLGNEIVARTVPGAGRATRATKSTRPQGQGTRGAYLPIARVGRIVSRAASAVSRPAKLGPSSTTSTGAPSLTGNLRGLCVLAGLTPARGALATLLGAVIATTSCI